MLQPKQNKKPRTAAAGAEGWDVTDHAILLQMGGAGKSPPPDFTQVAFAHDQVSRRTLATNLVFEISIPFGKQSGHDAPGWEFTSRWLVADPLSNLVLVKSHPSQLPHRPTNAKPGAAAVRDWGCRSFTCP